MKALVLAAFFAVLSANAPAGAARDARQPAAVDATTVVVVADAGRLGPASLTSLNGATHWSPPSRQASTDFDTLSEQVDPGTLVIVLTVAALAAVRPLGQVLRRREQRRRAAALASSLGHAQRG